MTTKPLPYRLRLFTLRLWQEVVNGELWEWRGEVKNTSSGEVRYFRDFQVLGDLLPMLLAKPVDDRAQLQGDDEMFRGQKERTMATTMQAFMASIHTTTRAFEAAFAQGDAAGAAAAYTTAGQAFPPNAPAVARSAAEQHFWQQQVMDSDAKYVTLETVEMEGCLWEW